VCARTLAGHPWWCAAPAMCISIHALADERVCFYSGNAMLLWQRPQLTVVCAKYAVCAVCMGGHLLYYLLLTSLWQRNAAGAATD
jgi:hypothetical protein